LAINKQVGVPFPEALVGVTLAQVHFALGDTATAQSLLDRAMRLAEAIGSRTLRMLGELTTAWFMLDRQDEVALAALRRGLRLQRRIGCRNFPGWRGEMMRPLLARALAGNIETDFTRQVIRARGMHHRAPPQAGESWPWPVKIHTLGRFSLQVDERPVPCHGKAQQKPLELLKTLIALGGRGIAKERLIDNLWPDTEGDKALRALDTTCEETARRQREATELASRADLTLVVGDRESANTRRLAELCAGLCPRCHRIESADAPEPDWLLGVETVAVTAGASTPAGAVAAVVARLRAMVQEST